MNTFRDARNRLGAVGWAVVAMATAGPGAMLAASTARADGPARAERLERRGAPARDGRLSLDPREGLVFRSADQPEGAAEPVESGSTIAFDDGGIATPAIPPLFEARIGESGRISGTLRKLGEDGFELTVPWQSDPILARRPGVQSVVQRFGEARVLADSFDALDASVWTVGGEPEVVADAGPTPADRSLRLPPGGASIERRFEDPLSAGRVEMTFWDDGKVRAGRQWTLGLTFRAPAGPATVRVVLGGEEDSLAVESPAGPSLAVQRLARSEGWRRLAVRFNADRTEISVDGKELAHGKGPSGPLESLRIATSGPSSETDGRGGLVGEVQAVRFAQPPSSLEIDPTQDEARLVVGDQLYGMLRGGDAELLEMLVDDRPTLLHWSELAGVFLARVPAAGTPVRGALARVEWRVSADAPERDFDFAEGAVTALSDSTLTLSTPYTGVLQIPRERLTRIQVLAPGWRQVIDPASHHLGDEISTTPPLLDPPLPEGGVLERSFELPDGLEGPRFLVLDVLQVVGETPGLPFSDYIRRGELKTFVEINGARVDYLNRYIRDANENVERIRIPLPIETLRPGKNLLRIVQTGIARNSTWFDDLGVLGIAVEVGRRPTPTDRPKEPAAAPTP